MTINLEGCLVGLGNPLLDISSPVDTALLEKYNLKSNDAIMAEDKHIPLFSDLISSYKVEYVAGGATQNAIRGAQWMLPPRSTVYMGCVGQNDEYAKSLRSAAEADGVRVEYMQDPQNAPTGTCAVLITGKDRSLVANLGAANNFNVSHLSKPEIAALIDNAKYFYIEGFFLTHGVESALYVAKHAAAANKTFMMNISAPFLCQFFKEQLEKMAPYWDVLFGNESEARAFSDAYGFGTQDISEIALKISQLPKANTSRPRTVIITQGGDPTVVVENGVLKTFPVIPIKPEAIIDSNGAGDAFCGGFFSQFVQGKAMEQCVAAGNYVANVVIQRSGATYPREKPTFQN